jgi:hypothetical protein
MSDETRKKLDAANAAARRKFLEELDADYDAQFDALKEVFEEKGPPDEDGD